MVLPSEHVFTEADAFYDPNPKHLSRLVLQPTVSLEQIADTGNSSLVLSPNQASDVRDGTQVVYLYGRIDYEDVFGQPHFNTFCVYYSGLVTKHVSSMASCENYNDAD